MWAKAILLFVSLLVMGCGRSPAVSNAREPERRTTVGNGGDSLRVLLEQGRRHAQGVVERLQVNTVDTPELRTILARRAAIVADISATPYDVGNQSRTACSDHPCGCTLPVAKAEISFSPDRCARRIANKYQAAALILHETFHHIFGSDEETADKHAAAVLQRWASMGHPDAPHWTQIPSTHFYPEAVYTGRKLISWSGENIREFDPISRTVVASHAKVATLPRRIEKKSKEASLWAGEQIHWFGKCRISNLVYSPTLHSWKKAEKPAMLADREKAFHFTGSGKIIVWGGTLCAPPGKVALDGAIFDTSTDLWTPIPEPVVPAGRWT